MMMNRTKSGVIDALLKLRFKGIPTSTRSFSESHFPALESLPSLASLFQINPCASYVDVSEYLAYKKRSLNMDEEMRTGFKFKFDPWLLKEEQEKQQKRKDPLPFVDEFTHLLAVVTEHNHDDFFIQNRVPFITSVLNTLIFADRTHEAYMLFNKLIKLKLLEPTIRMYNTVIKALCNNPDEHTMHDAVNLFQEMVSQQDIDTYNSLVSGLCKIRRWTKTTLLIQEMLDKDNPPDIETFNVLINTFCIEGRLQVARHVIDMMRERGVSPNLATYNLIIDAHCLMGEMDEARSLFNQMVSSHVAPDATTYNSLLIGYCDDEKIDNAMLDDDMQPMLDDSIPLMLDDAKLVYHEMNEKGFKPNWVTYNIMIRSCFKAARFADAHTLLNKLFAQGQSLGQVSYREIHRHLFFHYRFEEAFSLYHLLGDDSKLNSNIYVVHDLMCGAIRCGKLDFARELFEGLSVKGMKPTSDVYTTMIGGFCVEGLVNDAKRLFLEMEEKVCRPTDATFNFLLQGYLKNKCYDDVEMLLHKMKERYRCLYKLTLSLLHESIAAGSLDISILELMDNIERSKDADFDPMIF